MSPNRDARSNPIEIQRHLSGVDYPAKKDDLVRAAKAHDAPDDVLALLREIDDRTYESPTDVTSAVSHSGSGQKGQG